MVFACAIASAGASCSTVSPISAGVAGAPLPASRPTAVGLAAIAAVGQRGGDAPSWGPAETSVEVAPLFARRFNLAAGLSLEAGGSVGAYRSTQSADTPVAAGPTTRLWIGPDTDLPIGVEVDVVVRVGGVVVAPTVTTNLEARLLAACRLPGPGLLWLTTRPGIYSYFPSFDLRMASYELPIGAAFDVGPVRVGGELGLDWFPAGGVLGARANASAAATF